MDENNCRYRYINFNVLDDPVNEKVAPGDVVLDSDVATVSTRPELNELTRDNKLNLSTKSDDDDFSVELGLGYDDDCEDDRRDVTLEDVSVSSSQKEEMYLMDNSPEETIHERALRYRNEFSIAKKVMRVHKQSGTMEEVVIYQCHICSKWFKGVLPDKSMRQHYRDIHSIPALQCRMCGFKNSDRMLVERHVAVEHGVEVAKVEIFLKRVFFDKSLIYGGFKARKPNRKSAAATDSIEMLCFVCCQRFTGRMSKYILRRHIKTMHGPTRMFKCTICPRQYRRNDKALHHIRRHHGHVSELNLRDCIEIVELKG